MGTSRLAQPEKPARDAIFDWALHGGNVVSARFDGDEYEAFVRLAEMAGKRCEEAGRIFAVSFVERLHAPVSQGKKKSRLVALMRVMPGPDEKLVLLPGEEITAIIAPKKMARPGKDLFADVLHEDGCPRLKPDAAIASCRCSPDVVVRERDAVN